MNGYSRAAYALLGAAMFVQVLRPVAAAPQTGAISASSNPQPRVLLGPATYIRVVTDKDNKGAFTLPPETSLIVRLRTNPSTAYRWNLMMPPDMPIRLTDTPTYTADKTTPGVVGAGGVEQFDFAPKYLPGITQTFYLRLLSLRPFDKGITGAKLWEIKVTVPPQWTPPVQSSPDPH